MNVTDLSSARTPFEKRCVTNCRQPSIGLCQSIDNEIQNVSHPSRFLCSAMYMQTPSPIETKKPDHRCNISVIISYGILNENTKVYKVL